VRGRRGVTVRSRLVLTGYKLEESEQYIIEKV
jgi:hypothetical protein